MHVYFQITLGDGLTWNLPRLFVLGWSLLKRKINTLLNTKPNTDDLAFLGIRDLVQGICRARREPWGFSTEGPVLICLNSLYSLDLLPAICGCVQLMQE
jgi:hypothetical protein